jgi:hypothetical protein
MSFCSRPIQGIVAQVQAGGCTCGGVRHSARYPRKPRALQGMLDERYQNRLSFCCAREGCRRRSTPPSVRFLGRKLLSLLAPLTRGSWLGCLQLGADPQKV